MSIYKIAISAELKDLEVYRDQHLLIVNIADGCGFKPQLQDLELLHSDESIPCQVLAFPSNQFNQQSRDNHEMREWCSTHEKLTFPIMDSIILNGEGTHPLYQYLKSHAPGLLGRESIAWNYTKFLVGPREQFIKRFAPKTSIKQIRTLIEKI